jgi:hypothetical protein
MRARNESPRKGISKSSDESSDESSVEAADESGGRKRRENAEVT